MTVMMTRTTRTTTNMTMTNFKKKTHKTNIIIIIIMHSIVKKFKFLFFAAKDYTPATLIFFENVTKMDF